MSEAKTLSMTEEEMKIIQVGAGASFVWAHMKPILEATHGAALGRLKAMQQTGKFDPARAQAEVAAMLVVDEIGERLKSQIQQAVGMQSEIENRGGSNE